MVKKYQNKISEITLNKTKSNYSLEEQERKQKLLKMEIKSFKELIQVN